MNAPDAPVGNSAPAPSAQRRRVTVLLLLALLLLLGLVAAGWYCVQFQLVPQAASLVSRLAALEQHVQTSASRSATQDSRLQQLEQAAAARAGDVAAVRTEQADLAATVTQLAAQSSNPDRDWALAAIEHLITIADQRLALAHDLISARTALKAAVARLALNAEPALAPLREQLAHDQAALEAVAPPAVDELALKLAAIAARAESLPTKTIANNAAVVATPAPAPLIVDDWRAIAHALWRDLLSLVEIKDAALPDDVLFDPRLRQFLLQGLQLELASARLALLARDTANWRASSALITAQLERYYDLQDAGVKALLNTLAAAGALELDPALPNLAASLAAVRNARQAVTADQQP